MKQRDEELEEFGGGGIPDFLRDPSGAVQRRWTWMLPALLVGLAATAAFVMQLHPRYAATATVLVTSQQIREDLVRSTVQEDSFQRINALINSILSLNRLSKLIEEFDLYPEMSETLTRAEVAAAMRGHLSIEAVQGLGLSAHETARVFSITFESPQPAMAAEVANSLAGLFIAESIRARTQQAGLATKFLKAELDRAEKALRSQNSEIRRFKERHRGELPGEFQANLMKLERLQQQRQSLALQIAEAENRLVLLSNQASISGETFLALASPEQRLQAARADLESKLAAYTEKHPAVTLLRRSIARLEAELAATTEADDQSASSASSQPEAARWALRQLREQLSETEANLTDLDERVTRTPARQEELAALEERESVLRENYLEFLRKVQEAELAQSLEAAQQGARFSIADRATPPTQPTQARLNFLVVGVLFSFALAAAIGLLLEAIDPVLVSKDQIEALSDLPVLGSAPRLA